MRILIACCTVLFGCIWGVAAAAAPDHGPLEIQNRFPLHLIFLTPKPSDARLPGMGRLDAGLSVDYSSVYFHHRSSRWDVLADMELVVVQMDVRYGLTPRTAIEVDAPFVYMYDGFLDGFLGDYHSALGVGNYGREERPENDFAYVVTKDGRRWITGRSGRFGPADATVSLAWALTQPADDRVFDAVVKGALKVPVGDDEVGFGSGRFDFGLFVPMQWNLRPWNLYLMPGLILPSDPESPDAQVHARNSYSLFAGAAYGYTDRLDLLAQLNFYTSPIERTGIEELDNGALELGLGFRYAIGRTWGFQFAFGEDLSRAVPDFTVYLKLERTIWLAF